MNKSKGKFIVIEGLEGAGKSTAIKVAHQFLKSYVPEIILTREPGGTAIGESIRALIKEKMPDQIMDAYTELLLIYAARKQHLSQLIQPALAKGNWVICDRFELSTFAYQGGGREIPLASIRELSRLCLQGFKPDLTIFLDIKPEKGLQRITQRGETDRIENEPLDFFNRVYGAYQEAILNESNLIMIEADQSLDHIKEQLISSLQPIIQEVFDA